MDDKTRQLSKKRASQNTKKRITGSNSKKSPSISVLTSADDLLKNYRTATAFTTSGHAFNIQSLSPGDYVITLGLPIIKLLIDKGVKVDNVSDSKQVNSAIDKLNSQDKIEIFETEKFQDIMSVIICRGVKSVKFVNMPPEKCEKTPDGQHWKEVSVTDALSDSDRY